MSDDYGSSKSFSSVSESDSVSGSSESYEGTIPCEPCPYPVPRYITVNIPSGTFASNDCAFCNRDHSFILENFVEPTAPCVWYIDFIESTTCVAVEGPPVLQYDSVEMLVQLALPTSLPGYMWGVAAIWFRKTGTPDWYDSYVAKYWHLYINSCDELTGTINMPYWQYGRDGPTVCTVSAGGDDATIVF